jgi:hypothetical protein
MPTSQIEPNSMLKSIMKLLKSHNSISFGLARMYSCIIVSFLIIKSLLLFFVLKKSDLQTPDSIGYLELSQNMAQYYIERPSSTWELSLIRTPGYPFFLALFGSPTKTIIVFQLLIHILISLTSIFVIKKLIPQKFPNASILAFIMIQIESSLFVYTYRILSDLIFALFVIFLILLICGKHNHTKIDKLDGAIFFVLLSILMIRPVGIVLLPIFIFMFLVTEYKMLYARLLIFTALIFGAYSFYNYSITGVFTNSTIQNHNLLYWEGAGAKSISVQTGLDVIQNAERKRSAKIIGENPTLQLRDSYNQKRAIELITENKFSFIKMHSIGVAKILFGPNRYEIIAIFSDTGRITLPKWLMQALVGISLSITILISTLGMIGAFIYLKRGASFKLISITIFSFLVISSGPQAYGRFRVPIAALLIIFAALVITEKRFSLRNIRDI